jgi:hypothetical protein
MQYISSYPPYLEVVSSISNFLTEAIPKYFTNVNLMTTTSEVTKYNKFFKIENSCGYDKISTMFLKSYTDYISVPYVICGQSMAVFPEQVKYHI